MLETHKIVCPRCKLPYEAYAEVIRDKDGRILSMETLGDTHGRGVGLCPVNPDRKNRRQGNPELG